MKTSEFDYELPSELIAQHPIETRDHARLLVLNRVTGAIQHRHFYDLPELLVPGDLIVANDSRVIPARLFGRKREGGAKAELLLLRGIDANTWEALVRPGRRLQPGTFIDIEPAKPGDGPRLELVAEVLERLEGGVRLVRFSLGGDQLAAAVDHLGDTPLPPYINAALKDAERYQTVYANPKGSVAAPTAGLHFTPELIERLAVRGIAMRRLTVHIGLHTFQPISSDEIEAHPIHEEYATVTSEVAQACRETKAAGHRVVAVGTSTVRALESAAAGGRIEPYDGWTRLYIYPGFEYKAVDVMITNFHLPRTTLMALVSALAGTENIRAAYAEAIAQRYRFYSFGDSMLIL